jgi:hypothetical protein
MFDRAPARGNGHRQDDDDEDERHLDQVRPEGSGATSAGETADARGADPRRAPRRGVGAEVNRLFRYLPLHPGRATSLGMPAAKRFPRLGPRDGGAPRHSE